MAEEFSEEEAKHITMETCSCEESADNPAAENRDSEERGDSVETCSGEEPSALAVTVDSSENEREKDENCGGKSRRSSFPHDPAELQDLFHKALICRMSKEDLTFILKSGADVNGTIKRGLRPAHYAAFDNNVEGLKFLIEFHCRVNVHDSVGFTPVHICAKHGSYDSLKLLLDNGAHASFIGNFTLDDERSAWSEVCPEPINLALENGHVKCAELLLQHGAKVDNRYALGSEINLVPLENLDCLLLLLEHKADPNVLSRVGDSPLMTACKEQNLSAAELLIYYGANVNQQSIKRFEEKTPLYFCIMSGNCEMMALLLDNGADVHASVSRNNYALTFAVSRDRYMMSELLIAHGSDVNERNNDGLTPLLAACSNTGLRNQVELVRLLLINGADPNTHHHTMRYYTPSLAPIHEYFVFNRGENINEDVVKLLVKYGARVTFGISHSQTVIKEPFSVLNHVRKLDDYEDIFYLLLDVAEKFDCPTITKCDLIPVPKRQELLDLGSAPLSLKHISRLWLRNKLGPVLPDKVDLLPLPKILKSYILFYL